MLASRSATNTNLVPYLFGSILTVTPDDVWTVVGLGALIVVSIAVTGRALLAVVLDEDAARVAGIPARALNALLAVLTAVTVVAAMRIVGVLLVAALMVLPVATSRLLARSFRGTLLGAMARRRRVGRARSRRRAAVGARGGRRDRARERARVRDRVDRGRCTQRARPFIVGPRRRGSFGHGGGAAHDHDAGPLLSGPH